MNNQLVRVGLMLVVVIGLVFGVTYVSQNAPTTGHIKPKQTKVSHQIDAPTLVVPTERASWDPSEPFDLPTALRYSKEVEPGMDGHYDFVVGNVHNEPANVQLVNTSCKCADVQMGIVDARAIRQFMGEQSPPVTRIDNKVDAEKLLIAAAKNSQLLQGVQWKPLVKMETSSQVPTADPQTGITVAFIRLVFRPKDPGPVLVVAEVNHAGGGNEGKTAQCKFEVPINVVSPVMMHPVVKEIGDVRSGETRAMDFVLWSATRDTIPIRLPDLPEDPTYVFGKPEPLEPSGVVNELQKQKANRPGTKPKCGYRVSLTIHENLNGKLLELGPHHRRLYFNAGTEFESLCEVRGRVVGDVRLLDTTGAEAERIKFGDFDAERSISKTYQLQSFQPGMKFRLVATNPAALKVELKPKSGTSHLWELRVEIEKNTLAGPLPYGSSIVLETIGPKNRRVRVPVEGNATIR